MITKDLNTEFWVISDTHLIANSLHDEGQAFSQMQKTSQGKDLYYQETALTAFMRMAQRKKPAAIIVTGDITFNGERVSAEKFAEIFRPLKHTKVLVIPGNHDIFDGWAREFRGKKQFYAGEISPMFWRSIFAKSYRQAVDTDDSSLAYSVQLNPQYFLILADSNLYGKEETTAAPHTRGMIGKSQLKWIKKQLQYAEKNQLRPILFMHHNLYAHNPAVNKGYVVDDAVELRRLCSQYNVTSSFCSNDQGYGVVRVHSRHITYVRRDFDMTRYLTDQEKENYTLEHFHKYLKDLQLGSISADMMQSELNKYHDDIDLVRAMGKLFGWMNYHFFTGHNHIKASELNKIHSSKAYQVLIKHHPEYRLYLETLYDTSDHSNLQVKIKY